MPEIRDMIHTVYLKAVKLFKGTYHIVREEVAEIIAFVAVDSYGHIPIAYGLKGHSLPMSIM